MLTVKRKAYKHKDGSMIKATTFKIKDKGKKGRTPKSERFFHPKVHTGWKKGMALSTRRSKVLKAHGNSFLAAARAMQSLANVTTDAATRLAARADALYFFKWNRK
jgi:hypothetical protein